jgi:hypothetical protein
LKIFSEAVGKFKKKNLKQTVNNACRLILQKSTIAIVSASDRPSSNLLQRYLSRRDSHRPLAQMTGRQKENSSILHFFTVVLPQGAGICANVAADIIRLRQRFFEQTQGLNFEKI